MLTTSKPCLNLPFLLPGEQWTQDQRCLPVQQDSSPVQYTSTSARSTETSPISRSACSASATLQADVKYNTKLWNSASQPRTQACESTSVMNGSLDNAEPQPEREADLNRALEDISPLLRVLPQYAQQFAWHVKVRIVNACSLLMLHTLLAIIREYRYWLANFPRAALLRPTFIFGMAPWRNKMVSSSFRSIAALKHHTQHEFASALM